MKSKDFQTAVKHKFENGDGPEKIFLDLGGVVSKRTIHLWIKIIKGTGSINLLKPPGHPRTIRTKANIQKAKLRLAQKKRASTIELAAEMCISRTSTRRILRKDRGDFPYKKIKQPKLTDLQKKKRVQFANWVLNYYTKDNIGRWLLADEKFFDLDGVYNSQNDRVWAVRKEEDDEKDGLHEKTKFPQKVMEWLGVCGEGLTSPVILEDGTMDAERYIEEILSVALKCENKMLWNNWT